MSLILVLPLWSQRIVFLHTNDEHGHFYGINTKGSDKYTNSMAHLAAWLEVIRREVRTQGGEVIFSFGGDMNTGTPESDALKAAPDNDIFGLLNLDIAVVGNHEFDIPVEDFLRQTYHSSFPWISANIETKDGRPLFLPYKIIDTGEVKIAFLGLTTARTEIIGNPEIVKSVKFKKVLPEAKKYLPLLEKKADFTVALTHLGFDKNESETAEYTGDVGLARSTTGIDLILGGHSHDLIEGIKIKDTRIYQALWGNRYLLRVDYNIEPGKEPQFLGHKIIKLNSYPEAYTQKNDWFNDYLRAKVDLVKRRITHHKSKTEKLFSAIIGKSHGDFVHDRSTLFKESVPIGNLVTDSHRYMARADIAIMNSGGIRAGIAEGDITLRDVLTVAPFNNNIGIVFMTGTELQQMLYDKYLVNNKRIPQVSGIKVLVDRSAKKVTVLFNNKPVEPSKKYKVAMNAYIAGGGMGYPNFTEKGRFEDLGYSDAQALREFIQSRNGIHVRDFDKKRIIFRN